VITLMLLAFLKATMEALVRSIATVEK
jgi:hypothetical protein